MQYQEFGFVVEQMLEEDANHLLDVIIAEVERQGYRMGGGFSSISDKEFGFCGTMRRIWLELRAYWGSI